VFYFGKNSRKKKENKSIEALFFPIQFHNAIQFHTADQKIRGRKKKTTQLKVGQHCGIG
jgi:hypothetical protein